MIDRTFRQDLQRTFDLGAAYIMASEMPLMVAALDWSISPSDFIYRATFFGKSEVV